MARIKRTVSYDELMEELRGLGRAENVAGMARYGISVEKTLGVPMPEVRRMAKGVSDHGLALRLWDSGIHEARIMASLVDVPAEVDEAQMERWASDFDSWDVCDQVCGNLFDRTPYAQRKVVEWSAREEEFVKRAAFVLIAGLALHAKKLPDDIFVGFLPLIAREAGDPRNFVKKAVNWALRGIGKRSEMLRVKAIETAEGLRQSDSPTARWVAADALREFETKSHADTQRKAMKNGTPTGAKK